MRPRRSSLRSGSADKPAARGAASSGARHLRDRGVRHQCVPVRQTGGQCRRRCQSAMSVGQHKGSYIVSFNWQAEGCLRPWLGCLLESKGEGPNHRVRDCVRADEVARPSWDLVGGRHERRWKKRSIKHPLWHAASARSLPLRLGHTFETPRNSERRRAPHVRPVGFSSELFAFSGARSTSSLRPASRSGPVQSVFEVAAVPRTTLARSA